MKASETFPHNFGKLYHVRLTLIILINFTMYFSRSLASLWMSIRVLVQYDILLKCSVNLVRFGLNSSDCSFAHSSTSGICDTRNTQHL